MLLPVGGAGSSLVGIVEVGLLLITLDGGCGNSLLGLFMKGD